MMLGMSNSTGNEVELVARLKAYAARSLSSKSTGDQRMDPILTVLAEAALTIGKLHDHIEHLEKRVLKLELASGSLGSEPWAG